jgi:hypothetical protein
MPISVYELRTWLGDPSIFVLDCSSAGALVPHFADTIQSEFTFNPLDEDPIGSQPSRPSPGRPSPKSPGMEDLKSPSPRPDAASNAGGGSSGAKSASIVLAACGADEILPMDPQYPADIFTSCLTTPIPIALRWFILQVYTYPYAFILVNLLVSRDNAESSFVGGIEPGHRGGDSRKGRRQKDTQRWLELDLHRYRRHHCMELSSVGYVPKYVPSRLACRISVPVRCFPFYYKPLCDIFFEL